MNEFILQCKGCNTILAISQNYVNDPFQTPYDAFHLGANVCQNNDIITSKETNDKAHKLHFQSINAALERRKQEVLMLVETEKEIERQKNQKSIEN